MSLTKPLLSLCLLELNCLLESVHQDSQEVRHVSRSSRVNRAVNVV